MNRSLLDPFPVTRERFIQRSIKLNERRMFYFIGFACAVTAVAAGLISFQLEPSIGLVLLVAAGPIGAAVNINIMLFGHRKVRRWAERQAELDWDIAASLYKQHYLEVER